jgi:hypothetical protein
LASICWGGKTFPIFEADADPRLIREACIALGVDAVVSGDETVTEADIGQEDFKWLSHRQSHPVIGERGDRFVDIRTVSAAVLRSGRRPDDVQLVTWNDSDPLAPLLRVLYGQVGSNSPYEQRIASAVAVAFSQVEIGLNGQLPVDRGRLGPLSIGMWRVRHHRSFREVGAAVVDVESPRDLVRLWNLRAIGHVAIPWAAQTDPRVEDYARASLAVARIPEWGGEPGLLSAFSPTRDVPEPLMELLREHTSDDRTIVSWLDLEPHVRLGGPIRTEFRTYFEVAAEAAAGRAPTIRVPLPRTDLVPDESGMDGWQNAAFRVTVHSERNIGERRSFRAPGLRALSGALRWEVSSTSPMVRGVGDGVVIAAKVNDDFLRLGAIDSFPIINRLLLAAGIKASVGDAGRWSGRIIDLLGGAASSLACQPAIREVLDLAARAKGANPQELRNAAARHKGSWAGPDVYWRRDLSYESWVVGVLAAQQIIESALSYSCSSCGLRQTIPADRLGPTLTCNDCEAATPLSLQVVNGAGWRLKTRQLIDLKRLRSTLPIAACLRLFLDLGQAPDTLHYALGLDLELEGRKFEIDFAAFVNDDRGACLVIGEGKARNSFANDDISNLELVQEAIRSVGVECMIAVASSKDQLDRGEIIRLRESADRFLFGIQPLNGRGGYINMPIVLTKGSLTLPDSHESHPLRATGNLNRDIAELAQWTCERELGLEGYGDVAKRSLGWRELA